MENENKLKDFRLKRLNEHIKEKWGLVNKTFASIFPEEAKRKLQKSHCFVLMAVADQKPPIVNVSKEIIGKKFPRNK